MPDRTDFPLFLYNSLSKTKEKFDPLHPPFVGMYVCGPTVYGEPHLGHARAAITFDIVFRYLKHLGYQVRYVRNITDVGHLENEVEGTGEDKIAKKARLEELEPMEIVQRYTLSYHKGMDALNCLRPSIEPTASGHIPEQIRIVQKILDNGLAYEVNGTIYFDLDAYSKSNTYGELSGKVLDELQAGSRDTEGLDEKRNPHDFALWKKASPEHIMRWDSPWGEGFPGWHVECSTMSTKYLGETFDIHGGGLDLQFPHHEAEIAQCKGAHGTNPVRYWMHNNMITIDGAKMSKSAGNFITLDQLFSGDHELLDQPYSPMVARFLMLQSHYRSKIDFSNEALKAAEKGYQRLMNALKTADSIGELNSEPAPGDNELRALCDACYEKMSDDFNTAQVLAVLFELAGKVNAIANKQIDRSQYSTQAFEQVKQTMHTFAYDLLGLKGEPQADQHKTEELVKLLIDIRKQARDRKDFETSDIIRDELQALGIQLKDGKDGTTFEMDQT
ncbi:MAG: cysteine--tRNA ligase [Balneolaceae bacterium]